MLTLGGSGSDRRGTKDGVTHRPRARAESYLSFDLRRLSSWTTQHRVVDGFGVDLYPRAGPSTPSLGALPLSSSSPGSGPVRDPQLQSRDVRGHDAPSLKERRIYSRSIHFRSPDLDTVEAQLSLIRSGPGPL